MSPIIWDGMKLPAQIVSRVYYPNELLEKLISKQNGGQHITRKRDWVRKKLRGEGIINPGQSQESDSVGTLQSGTPGSGEQLGFQYRER